jgi:hypothetical protein
MTGLVILLVAGSSRPRMLAFNQFGLLLAAGAIVWSRGWHPTVEPTGQVLRPEPASADWPRVFALTKVCRLRNRTWAGSRWRRRLVVEPGRLRLDRERDPIEPGPSLLLAGSRYPSVHVLYPTQVRLLQPLLTRAGQPGLVLHLDSGEPVFLLSPEPREAMLSQLAAAGFPVDGAEQVETRTWAHTPRRPIRPFPPPPV